MCWDTGQPRAGLGLRWAAARPLTVVERAPTCDCSHPGVSADGSRPVRTQSARPAPLYVQLTWCRCRGPALGRGALCTGQRETRVQVTGEASAGRSPRPTWPFYAAPGGRGPAVLWLSLLVCLTGSSPCLLSRWVARRVSESSRVVEALRQVGEGGQMLQCTGGVSPVALGATPEQTWVLRSPSFGQGSLSVIHKGLFSCTWGDSALLTMANTSSCTHAGSGPSVCPACMFSFHGDPVRRALITYAHELSFNRRGS